MRSIKDVIQNKFKVGNWYIIMIDGYDMDDYWLFKFHGMDNQFIIQDGTSFVFNKNDDGEIINFDPCHSPNNLTSPLCYIDEVKDIRWVSDSLALSYIERYYNGF